MEGIVIKSEKPSGSGSGRKRQMSKRLTLASLATITGSSHQDSFDEVSSTRRRSGSSSTSATAFPYRRPGYRINKKYQNYFEYVFHTDLIKLVVKCKQGKFTKVVNEVVSEQVNSINSVEEPIHENCGQLIAISEGTYGNLKRHLKGIHKFDIDHDDANNIANILARARDKSEAELPLSAPFGNPHTHPVPDGNDYDIRIEQLRFDNNVLDMFAEGLPFTFVTRRSFKEAVRNLNPRIKVKSCTVYTKKFEKQIQNTVKPNIREMLEDVPYQGAHFTVDVWSKIRRVPVLGIKLHYIDSDWRYRIVTFALTELNEFISAENIKLKFDEILSSFDFDDAKMGVVISDNTLDTEKAFNLDGILQPIARSEWVEEDVVDSDEDCDVELPDTDDESGPEAGIGAGTIVETDWIMDTIGLGWNPCLAHTIQLVINGNIKGNSTVTQIVDTVNKIATFFKRSRKWDAVFKSEVLGICNCENETGHDLKSPLNGTHWNSLFYVMEKLALWDVFMTVQCILRRVHADDTIKNPPALIPSSLFEQLIELCAILKPLQVLINRLQSDNLTSNITILSIVTAFKGVLAVPIKYFGEFKDSLLNNIICRLQGFVNNKFFLLASVLDPRQKLKLFQRVKWDELKLDLPSSSKVEEEVQTELLVLRNYYSVESREVDVDDTSDYSGAPQMKKIKDELFSILHEIENDESSYHTSLAEYYAYIAEPVEDDTCDPLQYWRCQENRFPQISVLAKRILGIPASRGSVERLLSTTRALGTARRNKLGINVVESLIMRWECEDSMYLP